LKKERPDREITRLRERNGENQLRRRKQRIRLTTEFANLRFLGASLSETKTEKGFIFFESGDKDPNAYQKKYSVVNGFYSVQSFFQPVQSQSNRFSPKEESGRSFRSFERERKRQIL
jgi:hypothetical protein